MPPAQAPNARFAGSNQAATKRRARRAAGRPTGARRAAGELRGRRQHAPAGPRTGATAAGELREYAQFVRDVPPAPWRFVTEAAFEASVAAEADALGRSAASPRYRVRDGQGDAEAGAVLEGVGREAFGALWVRMPSFGAPDQAGYQAAVDAIMASAGGASTRPSQPL